MHNHTTIDIKKKLILLVVLMTALLATTVTSVDALTWSATAKVNSADGAYMRKSPTTKNDKNKIAILNDNRNIEIKKEVFTNKTKTGKTYKWYYIAVSGKSGYIRSDCVDSISYTTVKGSTKAKLNYRVGPGTGMKVAGTLKKKAKVSIVLKANLKGSSQVWYKIKIKSKYYYVSSKYIKLGSNDPSKPNITTTNLSYPTEVWQGVPFYLRGTINSDQIIEKVRLGIRNQENKLWVVPSKPVENDMVNSTTFDISTLDAQVPFGSLSKGAYVYRVDVCIGGKWKNNIVRKSFKVKVIPNGKGAAVIAEQAIKLAWANDADYKTKSAFNGGEATIEFKEAFDSVFPTHSGWTNKFTKVGADCGVFVATVIRSCGYDPTFNYYLTGANSLFNVLPKYPQTWTQVISYDKSNGDVLTLNESLFKSGDIIMYHKPSGQHILIYVKVGDKGYMVEAGNTGSASTRYYRRMDEVTDKITDIKGRGYKDFYVYRAAK